MAKQEIKPVYLFVHKVMSEPSLMKYVRAHFLACSSLGIIFFNARGFLINNYIILLLKNILFTQLNLILTKAYCIVLHNKRLFQLLAVKSAPLIEELLIPIYLECQKFSAGHLEIQAILNAIIMLGL